MFKLKDKPTTSAVLTKRMRASSDELYQERCRVSFRSEAGKWPKEEKCQECSLENLVKRIMKLRGKSETPDFSGCSRSNGGMSDGCRAPTGRCSRWRSGRLLSILRRTDTSRRDAAPAANQLDADNDLSSASRRYGTRTTRLCSVYDHRRGCSEGVMKGRTRSAGGRQA